MIDIELLPCPFCGRKNKTYSFKDGANNMLFSMNCGTINCPARSSFALGSEAEVAAAWNLRATPSASTPAAAEMARDFDHLKLTSWTDLENYGEKFCEAFNAGVAACAAPLPRQAAVQGEWLPIGTAPLDGREVILAVKYRAGIPGKQLVGHYMPGGHCIEDHPSIASGWYFWNGCMFDRASEPTHWMPIPAAPTVKASQ